MTAARCRPTSEHEIAVAKIKLAGSLALLVVLCVLFLLSGCVKRDDTDSQDGISGMGLFTDHGTGCQYLGYGVGSSGKALTPRIAADGKSHLGCKGTQP